MSTSKVKSKIKVKKAQSESDSDDGSEHELFYYANNRVQLMKEVLKLLKPKKIKAIAPDFMKNLDIQEINSMLLEELLGISNKRLRNILNGVNVDDSSSESEEDKQPIDIISLDDISEGEDFNSDCNGKLEPQKGKKSKKDKHTKVKTEKVDEKEKLMSVLEILELQARARAIRSQLALENQQKNKEENKQKAVDTDDSDIEEIIVQDSKKEEIVVIDSENENNEGNKVDGQSENVENEEKGDRSVTEESNREENCNKNIEKSCSKNDGIEKQNIKKDLSVEVINKVDDNEKKENVGGNSEAVESHYAEDTVVINLDSVEIEEMDK